MKMTTAQYHEACDENAGYCAQCDGLTVESGVEPDASGYDCPGCPWKAVMGVEQALIEGRIEVSDDGTTKA